MRRSLLILIAGALTLAACAEPAPTGDGGPDPSVTRLDVYEAMVRHLAAQEDFSWAEVVIVRGICSDASEPADHTGCQETFSQADESALVARLVDLAPTVRFVTDPARLFDKDWFEGGPDRIVVWLGPVVDKGEEVHVGGSFGCGGLCGSGSTWVLRNEEGRWQVTGSTGGTWIA
jgi:hypothetical protein